MTQRFAARFLVLDLSHSDVHVHVHVASLFLLFAGDLRLAADVRRRRLAFRRAAGLPGQLLAAGVGRVAHGPQETLREGRASGSRFRQRLLR